MRENKGQSEREGENESSRKVFHKGQKQSATVKSVKSLEAEKSQQSLCYCTSSF